MKVRPYAVPSGFAGTESILSSLYRVIFSYRNVIWYARWYSCTIFFQKEEDVNGDRTNSRR